jgi:membrane protein
MARLSDFPRVIKRIGWYRFGKRVLDESIRDNLMTWAAALAYSWLFAIFPFFIFLLALLPYLPREAKTRARHEIHTELKQMIPESAEMIWHNINDNYLSLLYQPRGTLLYVGLGVALWAASSGLTMTMSALDRCYDIETGRPFYIQRPLAILLTIIVVILLLLVGFLLPIGSAVKVWVIHVGYATRLSMPIFVFDLARWTLSLLFMMTLLSILYYKGPAIRHPYRWLTPGALFSVLVWVILAIVFRYYVDRIGGKGYEKTYGTLGGVAILMLFFYIDALVLLIGAEINSEIDFEVLNIPRGSNDFRRPLDTTSNTVTSI